MEVRAVCISLMTSVLFLICALCHTVDSVSLRVVPNRLQFFEYEAVTLLCGGLEDSAGWRLVREDIGDVVKSVTVKKTPTELSFIFKNLYTDESGQYWCERGQKRSNSINITVTNGSVVLDSLVLPVMEGHPVTLSCRNKTMSSNLTAGFYKDGVLIGSSSTGRVTVLRVSKSDEGLYKCRFPDGGGQSAESWLTVTDSVHSESSPPSSSPPSSSSTPWIVVTAVLLLVLLVVGLLHLDKNYRHRALVYLSTLFPGSSSAQDQTVSAEVSQAAAGQATYAAVRKNRKKDVEELTPGAVYYTLSLDEPQPETHCPEAPRASSSTPIPAPSKRADPPEEVFYSTIP